MYVEGFDLITKAITCLRHRVRNTVVTLALTTMLLPFSLFADSTMLEQAVKVYYAGRIDHAIAMIRPLAESGDADAQYLLGNILNGLVKVGKYADRNEPLRWYQAAAAQDLPKAAFAAGVVYYNIWVATGDAENARQAERYYRQAVDLGDDRARDSLDKLLGQIKTVNKTPSLTYTNESFASTAKSRTVGDEQVSAGERNVGKSEPMAELIANNARIESLIKQLDKNNELSMDSLTTLLSANLPKDNLISELMKLLQTVREATELSSAPGSN